MTLSPELLRSFADAVAPEKNRNRESIIYGTVSSVEEDGTAMVRLDGAEVDIPAACSTSVSEYDRVLVMLKGRQAIVTGNLTGTGGSESDFQRITNEEIDELFSSEEGE